MHMKDVTHLFVRCDSFRVCGSKITMTVRDSLICETWLTCMWNVTYLYVRRDSFICEMWLIQGVWIESHDAWLGEEWWYWDMTHAYVKHDSFICETWLIHMCEMWRWLTRGGMLILRHVSCVCETWLIHVWDMTDSCVRHDSFICVRRDDCWHSEECCDWFVYVYTYYIHICIHIYTHKYIYLYIHIYI